MLPKRHIVDLTDTPSETVAGMVAIGQPIARAARNFGLHADGNNVVIDDGKAAFQSVCRLHLRVVPHHDGDKLSFTERHVASPGRRWQRKPDGCCGRPWRSSTRLRKTERHGFTGGTPGALARV